MLELFRFIAFSNSLRTALVFLSAIYSLTVVTGLPVNAGDTAFPDGSTNHGNPSLLCTPTTWSDVLVFYLGNYIAHVATIKEYPGESGIDFMVNAIVAILFPTVGMARGIDAIIRHPQVRVKGGELQRAARAGALCMVVRSPDWKPGIGDHIRDAELVRQTSKPSSEPGSANGGTKTAGGMNNVYWPSMHGGGICFKERNIHGSCVLPAGYSLIPVPHDASSTIKIFAASLFQNQIARYGYAAFSLTVAPYALMSAVNLEAKQRPGQCLLEVNPNSSTRTDLVSSAGAKEIDPPSLTGIVVPASFTKIEKVDPASSTVIEEVDGIEGDFTAQTIRDWSSNEKPLLFRTHRSPNHSDQKYYEVIEAKEPHEHSVLGIPRCPRFYRRSPTTGERRLPRKTTEVGPDPTSAAWAICLAFGSIPIAIVGALSHFHSGQSTKAQRVWIMMWLVFGVVLGSMMAVAPVSGSLHIVKTPEANATTGTISRPPDEAASNEGAHATARSSHFFYGTPAVGGLIVVGKMLFEYGSCTELG
ncbi:hypothetical protein BD779DRAFT_1539409 [Infundibulicybe gibba]|nr:hypothetical protein BD779DRAFT_1539409 [Infundibulicybe gibba]